MEDAVGSKRKNPYKSRTPEEVKGDRRPPKHIPYLWWLCDVAEFQQAMVEIRDKGSDPTVTYRGKSCIMACCECTYDEELRKESLEVVKMLLSANADINAEGHNQETALHCASKHDLPEMAALLLKSGANVNAETEEEYKETPLHEACRNNNPTLVKILLDNGADIHRRTGMHEESVLHLAASKGADKVLSLLLEQSADINARNRYSCTPLVDACEKFQVDCVKLLLKHRADVTIKKYNQTPLQFMQAKKVKEIDRDSPSTETLYRGHQFFDDRSEEEKRYCREMGAKEEIISLLQNDS